MVSTTLPNRSGALGAGFASFAGTEAVAGVLVEDVAALACLPAVLVSGAIVGLGSFGAGIAAASDVLEESFPPGTGGFERPKKAAAPTISIAKRKVPVANKNVGEYHRLNWAVPPRDFFINHPLLEDPWGALGIVIF